MNQKEKIVGEKTGIISKVIIYVMLAVLTVTIVVPVAWVFMASVKQNSEFYGNPFALPQGVYLQNFADAWTKARMGDYFFTSVLITAVALAILLIVALPASYVPVSYTHLDVYKRQSPWVSVRNSLRYPNNPRDGMRNSTRIRLVPKGAI